MPVLTVISKNQMISYCLLLLPICLNTVAILKVAIQRQNLNSFFLETTVMTISEQDERKNIVLDNFLNYPFEKHHEG